MKIIDKTSEGVRVFEFETGEFYKCIRAGDRGYVNKIAFACKYGSMKAVWITTPGAVISDLTVGINEMLFIKVNGELTFTN